MSIDEVRRMVEERAQKDRIEQEEKQKEQTIEFLTKILTAAFDRGAAYTNLVIFAGYVAIFAVWNLTKDEIPGWADNTTGLLILVSVSVFVGFEVYKMIRHTQIVMGLEKVVEPGQTPAQFQAALKQYQAKEDKAKIRFVRVWVTTLIVVVPTAYGAGLILAGLFVYNLFF